MKNFTLGCRELPSSNWPRSGLQARFAPGGNHSFTKGGPPNRESLKGRIKHTTGGDDNIK